MNGQVIVPAAPSDAAELASVAARTFPLACPAHMSSADVEAFVATNLSAERFTAFLADPQRQVLCAVEGTPARRITGYALLVAAEPTDPDVARVVDTRPVVELSKFYLLPESHGSGTARALMATTIGAAAACGARALWLGVNQQNLRAQRFYGKHGFEVVGTKTFQVGTRVENDFVMRRPLP